MQNNDDPAKHALELDATERAQVSPELCRSAEELFPVFYAEVRRLARRERLRVGADETLQTTALIHEAYLRLRESARYQDHAHFLRAAALSMRHVLINHARDSVAAKRGGGATHLSLEFAESEAAPIPFESDERLLAIHGLLQKLSALNPRLSQVVECRFFAGYSETETAQALGIDERTVRRDWVKARAWLRSELGGELG